MHGPGYLRELTYYTTCHFTSLPFSSYRVFDDGEHRARRRCRSLDLRGWRGNVPFRQVMA